MRSLGRTLFAGLVAALALGVLASAAVADTGTAPSIAEESLSNVSEHDATLEAQIETGGLETIYEFQIDTNASYNYMKSACPLGECDAISMGEPLPAGLVEPQPQSIPAGNGDQAVSLDLASIGATLQPATTYNYRVLAKSGGNPTVLGPDQTFTTPTEGAIAKTPEEPLPSGAQSGPAGGSQPAGLPAFLSPPPLTPVDLASSSVSTVTKSTGTGDVSKLAKALKACEEKPKRQRATCRKRAEKAYARSAEKRQ